MNPWQTLLPLLRRLPRAARPKPTDSIRRLRGAHRRLGRRGEQLAARHLKKQGYRLLARNLRSRAGEIDLVMLDPHGTVVIVEVKAGRRHDAFRPEQHVTPAEQRQLVGLAAGLARRQGWAGKPWRFDVVAVDFDQDGTPTLRHHRAAFMSPA